MEERKYCTLVVREPMNDDEAVLIAVSSPYAYGYLAEELGPSWLGARTLKTR